MGWIISNKNYLQRDYQKGLPTSCQILESNNQQSIINSTCKKPCSCFFEWKLFQSRFDLKLILGFLAELFRKLLKYRYIDIGRSVISAFHGTVDSITLGWMAPAFPQMIRICNKSLPQPINHLGYRENFKFPKKFHRKIYFVRETTYS